MPVPGLENPGLEIPAALRITVALLLFSPGHPMPEHNRPDGAANALTDRLLVRELVENWALYRDAGDWEAFRSVWHDDGRMMATWCQADADGFIAASRQGWAKGVSILHFLGGSSIRIVEDRALAQTKMTISQRATVDGVMVDVVCTGRFFDFIERRQGKWGYVLRQPIYEKDRMDPVDPGVLLTLDAELLARFPEGYRHLAYLQTRIGYEVKKDMPGLKGAEVEALYARGTAWLAGAAAAP
jgi:SnoaL-like domain